MLADFFAWWGSFVLNTSFSDFSHIFGTRNARNFFLMVFFGGVAHLVLRSSLVARSQSFRTSVTGSGFPALCSNMADVTWPLAPRGVKRSGFGMRCSGK